MALSHKVGEDLSEMWMNAMQNFMPIGKALAEKSVTIQKSDKGTVNLVSRPYHHKAGR